MKQELNKITTLKQPKFNELKAEKDLKKALDKLSLDIIKVNDLATSKNIYVHVDETMERKKVISSLFPFLHNTQRTFNKYEIKDIVKDVSFEYDQRIRTALSCVGFQSINEKTKTIKCHKTHSFGNINLYFLNRVAEFQTNLNDTGKDSECIEILREYQNLNVEFQFKNDVDYETFKELVYFCNDETKFIINNAPKEVIEAYADKKKEKYYNEVCVLHEWSKANFKEFSYSNPINTTLINKCWGL